MTRRRVHFTPATDRPPAPGEHPFTFASRWLPAGSRGISKPMPASVSLFLNPLDDWLIAAAGTSLPESGNNTSHEETIDDFGSIKPQILKE